MIFIKLFLTHQSAPNQDSLLLLKAQGAFFSAWEFGNVWFGYLHFHPRGIMGI